ncbi:hypothetical protein FJ872_19305 [Mesorhizobium sp. B2-5-9]|uniref:hypothetical protein n=1 Tax=Mesorhizobium sp. B2-5-9 TaxID=2589921 RepID=UPI00112BE974|nr:hypothetical protein [Mesorhizobium sp. B2-5-9]TPK15148.1 hypothetical protein FJ872_19305 [Mesorhizobium sp. B2-5-9]
MAETDPRELPQRWRELDKRTIEMVARWNEPERERLIQLSHLSKKQLDRLDDFLKLPDDKWEAGFRIVTRSVVITKASKTILKMTLGLAAVLVAFGQIWAWVAPYVVRSIK